MRFMESLTGKKKNIITKRGNDSILKALKIGRGLGYKKV
jgi:hypothetical protein